jgi:ABC-type multidrug transport system fused ATPase/permease subunit
MVSAACILLLLFWISPVPATILALLLGGAYVLVFRLVRRLLQQNGERAAAAGRSLVKSVAEACGGIKEIKLGGLEREFVSRHADSSRALADCQATGSIVPMLPRYVLEVVAFGSVIALVVVLFGSDRSFSAIVPEMTIFVVAGYRLMPALQAVFNGLAQVRYHQAALERVTHDLAGAPQPAPHAPGAAKLPLQQEIALNGVSFTYPAAGQPSLIDITLTIPARSTVALVGPSGSGKSTLADLILGLLPPDKGEIAVDGLPLVGERMRSWQQSVGYVPQAVFLADDTVSRNIAFGLPAGQIDQSAVVAAARLANIHEFIEHELPEGFETLIGERGVRLSGGQRQRLGIARALYHSPQVLVLDEATNSLDGLAEEAIIEAIRLLARRVTVIMIAHRLATVRECDTLFLFDEGRVVDSGSFSDLVERNEQFQSLVQSSMGAAAATLSPTV